MCFRCFAPSPLTCPLIRVILCPLTAQGNSHSQDLPMTSSVITNHLHAAELLHVLGTVLSDLNVCIIVLFLFVYFWLCCVLAVLGLSSCRSGDTVLGCRAQASHCGGFPCGALAVGCMDVSSCGAGLHCLSVTCGIFLHKWIELVSLLLAGTLNHWISREVHFASLF